MDSPDILTDVSTAIGTTVTDFMQRLFGPALSEFGQMAGDKVRLYRFGQAMRAISKAEKMAENAGYTAKAVPIKLLFPILEGASLEEDEGLHDMWAALLANAASPDSDSVRPGFIAILKQMASDEAAFLNSFFDHYADAQWSISAGELAKFLLGAGEDEYVPDADKYEIHAGGHAVLDSLEANQLIRRAYFTTEDQGFQHVFGHKTVPHHYVLTKRGRDFIEACRPPTRKEDS
jgi:hypothetical protein